MRVRQPGQRLRAVVRSRDMVARLSGDAFASVLAATATAPLALRFACRRDVDLAVSEATFAYNPWTARL